MILDPHKIYAANVSYIESHGWKRHAVGFGWFEHETKHPYAASLGEAVVECLLVDGVDILSEPPKLSDNPFPPELFRESERVG